MIQLQLHEDDIVVYRDTDIDALIEDMRFEDQERVRDSVLAAHDQSAQTWRIVVVHRTYVSVIEDTDRVLLVPPPCTRTA